jgi:hypothetical protein
MQTDKQIPFYAADGRPLGFRTLTAARRLIAGGFVKPSYGRKGHLRAIWLQREDGSSPVASHAPRGTSYSFVEPLEHGRCWSLRRIVTDHQETSFFEPHSAGRLAACWCLSRR